MIPTYDGDVSCFIDYSAKRYVYSFGIGDKWYPLQLASSLTQCKWETQAYCQEVH